MSKETFKRALKTNDTYIKTLGEMDIKSIEDLLNYLPRTHEDRSQVLTVGTASMMMEQKVSIAGVMEQVKLIRTKHGKQLVTALLTDDDGESIECIWFNQPHMKRTIHEGRRVTATGKVVSKGLKLQLMSPQLDTTDLTTVVAAHSGRLIPIYPEHSIITSKWLREKIVHVKKYIKDIPETLNTNILEEHNLLSRAATIEALHFPDDHTQVEEALRRLAFERMFAMQLESIERRQDWQQDKQERLKIPMDIEMVKACFASLSFTPTDDQRVAIFEILKDLEREVPMSRLLEGDVGSGKTLVAMVVMTEVMVAGGQCALMVPTEVLAKQHSISIQQTIDTFYEALNLPPPRIALLTGSLKPAEAKTIRDGLGNGSIQAVIGTHSLISDTTDFADLRLAIIDEQHRFGVQQRAALQRKGTPHLLTMTATPIPRTLALTAYGHHDLSVLLEKPGNRKSIETKVVPPTDRFTVEKFIDLQLEEGRQAFVICPLISDSKSDTMVEVKSVEQEAARLREAFSHRQISVLHGRMKPEEKAMIMQNFKDMQADILVSTSVIEVGIDIPNATIMCIEGAERFGLSQLHQFRGRVGRSDAKSYCFLFTSKKQQAYITRLKAMEEYSSGFELAEIDLKLRGPGEIFGLRQSGAFVDQIGKYFHPEFIVKVRKSAEKYLKVAEVKDVAEV